VDIEQSYRWLKSPNHLTSECPILAKNELAFKTQTNGTHTPKPVYEKGDVTLLWNQEVHTDRKITANRPDIIIKNKKGKTSTLTDVAIPANRNVVQKEAEKS
jgi:hypothetical protein